MNQSQAILATSDDIAAMYDLAIIPKFRPIKCRGCKSPVGRADGITFFLYGEKIPEVVTKLHFSCRECGQHMQFHRPKRQP